MSLVLENRGNEYHGYYVDSLGNNITGNVASILSQHRIMIYDLSNQQQRDGHNCGLWALENGQRISEFLSNNGEIGNTDVNSIRNSLARSRSEEEFEDIRSNILRELLNDNQRRTHLDNIGIAQIEIPQDYNDNYNLYTDGRQALEQCAMLAMIGSSIKLAKSKRSITATDNRNDHKLLLESQKFVDCAYGVKQEVISSQLRSLVNHFKVVGDNKSCKAIDKLIINQGIINRLNSIDKTVPIEVINIKNAGYNWSALHVAAQLGDVEEAEKLIKHGVDVNVRARDGWSPLHLASQYANKEVVSLLIKYGADPHAYSEYWWWTPLHLAVQSSDEVTTNILLQEFKQKRISISIKANGGWTPLHLAIQAGNKEVIDLLVKEGADVNVPAKGGWRPLHLAIKYNNTDVVRLLLEKVTDINSEVKGHNKWRALDFAQQLNNQDIIELLNLKNKEISIDSTTIASSGKMYVPNHNSGSNDLDVLAKKAIIVVKNGVSKILKELELKNDDNVEQGHREGVVYHHQIVRRDVDDEVNDNIMSNAASITSSPVNDIINLFKSNLNKQSELSKVFNPMNYINWFITEDIEKMSMDAGQIMDNSANNASSINAVNYDLLDIAKPL